jgi:hypothetical protein
MSNLKKTIMKFEIKKTKKWILPETAVNTNFLMQQLLLKKFLYFCKKRI